MSSLIPTSSLSPTSSGSFTSTSAANVAANAAAAANGTTTSTSSSAASSTGLSATYSDFLKILTTELQNQDPTQPTDPTEFVTQLTQLNSVQQQVNTNTTLTAIQAQLQASAGANTSNLVGDSIIAQSGSLTLSSGQAEFGYTIPANIKTANIVIKDSSGNQVFTTTATPTAGNHTYTWNGQNTAGTQLTDGNYTVSVTTADNNGTAGTAPTTVAATVQGVDLSQSTPQLILGDGSEVPISSVQEVSKSN